MARKPVVKEDGPKGWEEQGGKVNMWEEGEEIEGIYQGLTPARGEDSSPVVRIHTADGTLRYWCPTILESKLVDVETGTPVMIRCLGRVEPVKSRKGTMAWGFKVFTKSGR